MRKYGTVAAFVAAAGVILVGVAYSASITRAIPMENVGVRGNAYIVAFDIPEDLAGKRLDSVLLDFAVDVTATSEADADASPWIGAYPLTAATTAQSLDYISDVPSVRPIAMGQDQRVRIDITDIVRAWLANPASNHGLAIGALTGPEVATVSLKSDAIDGAALRVTFFYQNRSGGRVSAK